MNNVTLGIRSALVGALSLSPVFAQEVELRIAQPADQVLRFTIESQLESETERQMLIDGEERGGGRGGPRGASELRQKIEFEQGPADANWRKYHTLEATSLRMGRDGEPVERATTGALEGKTIRVTQGDDGATLAVEGDGEDGQALPAAMTRNLPTRVDLSRLLPAQTVTVGAEFALDDGFRAALGGLVHPIVGDRDDAEASDQPRGRNGGDAPGGRRGRG
ncbi:MAG: hypothetical protein AAF628_23815, partial [Planctomycetota bacterium]